ncbi:MAG: hypothetical protein ACRDTD_32465 [Pseudonocardiaceae bacterium]
MPGGVVDTLQGAGEEFEPDVVGAQAFGDGQELGGAASEAFRTDPPPGRETRIPEASAP